MTVPPFEPLVLHGAKFHFFLNQLLLDSELWRIVVLEAGLDHLRKLGRFIVSGMSQFYTLGRRDRPHSPDIGGGGNVRF